MRAVHRLNPSLVSQKVLKSTNLEVSVKEVKGQRDSILNKELKLFEHFLPR